MLPGLSPERVHPLFRRGRIKVVLSKLYREFNPTAGRGLAGRMSSAAKFYLDATPDALHEMEKGNLAVTVFQNLKAHGRGSVETAVKLARAKRSIPSQLITRDNYKEFLNKQRVPTIDACSNIVQEVFS